MGGRRERKRRETRERIVNAAMRLFLKLGYDATTMDAIAEAADISRRSLFDYFPAKEDILFAHQEEFRAAVMDEMRRRPKNESWPVLVERAIVQAVVDAASPENIAIDALIRRTPALEARYQLKYVHLEQAIAQVLLEKGDGSGAERRHAELLAAVVVDGFRLATREATYGTAKDPDDIRRSASHEFQEFWRILSKIGQDGLKSRPSRRAMPQNLRNVTNKSTKKR